MSTTVQIEQKIYEMPPREGISIAHFLTVADIERSARYYETSYGVEGPCVSLEPPQPLHGILTVHWTLR